MVTNNCQSLPILPARIIAGGYQGQIFELCKIFYLPPLQTETTYLECAACLGGIAQLGERLHGMQEVSGSIPLTSTKNQIVGKTGRCQ